MNFKRNDCNCCLMSRQNLKVNGHWYAQKSWSGAFLEGSEVITQLHIPNFKKIKTQNGVALTNE